MTCHTRDATAPSTCADCALDAIIVGSAIITALQPHDPRTTHAAARMELLAGCRRAKLLDTPLLRPVLAEFTRLVGQFEREPFRMRRAMVLAMDRVVGTGHAEQVLEIVERVGCITIPVGETGQSWLGRMRLSLGLGADLSRPPPAATAPPPAPNPASRRRRTRYGTSGRGEGQEPSGDTIAPPSVMQGDSIR